MLTLNLSIQLVNSPPHINIDDLPSLIEGINIIWEVVEIKFKLIRYSHRYIGNWPDIDALASHCTRSPNGTLHGFYGCWFSDPTDANRQFWPASKKRVYRVPDHPLFPLDPTPSLVKVSCQQIGQILGLRQYQEPKGFLMTTNDPGMDFQDQEMLTAAKRARRIVSGRF